MNMWEHLFLTGEFSARAELLSGLTLEQVTLRPDGASHSIYDELWHLTVWQKQHVERDPTIVDAYPSAVPGHEQEWEDLVRLFLDSARAVVEFAESPERLAMEFEPGETMADALNSLAVHNAYHFGKIVALRQRIGAWPPKAAGGDST